MESSQTSWGGNRRGAGRKKKAVDKRSTPIKLSVGVFQRWSDLNNRVGLPTHNAVAEYLLRISPIFLMIIQKGELLLRNCNVLVA